MTKPRAATIRRIRIAIAIGILAVIAGGVFFKGDIGTLCAWCPIGWAQASVAARAFIPGIATVLIVCTAMALVVGRAFCAWGCPANLLKRRKSSSPKPTRGASERNEAHRKEIDASNARMSSCNLCAAAGKRDNPQAKNNDIARSLVLVGGLLAVSLAVGFPVFCLICPIGLVFGFLFAIFKSLTVYQPSWDLVIFPLMLFVEFRLLRSWCRLICPIGALLSLISRINPRRIFLRANRKRCQLDKGCHACEEACPESIPSTHIGKIPDEACTLCLECTAVCPHDALNSLTLGGSGEEGGREETGSTQSTT